MTRLSATEYIAQALRFKSIIATSVDILPMETAPSTIPQEYWYTRHLGTQELIVLGGLLAADEEAADTIIQSLDPVPHELKSLLEIYIAIGGLSGSQLQKIWQDLMTGSPTKLAHDTGPFSGSVLVLDFVAGLGSLSTLEATEGKKRAITLYTSDHGFWLIRPVFDTTINISAWRPI